MGGCAVNAPDRQTDRQPAPMRADWATVSRREGASPGADMNLAGLGKAESVSNLNPSQGGPLPSKVLEKVDAYPRGDGLLGLEWVASLGDSGLTAAVEQALAHNYDLQASASRVARALATVRSTAAGRYPALSGSFGASRQRTNVDLGEGASGSPGGGQGNAPTGVISNRTNQFSALGEISWELDLWGRLADQQSAEVAAAQASLADYYGARLSLAGGTSRAWIDVATARRQLDLAQETEESFRTTLALIERRYERGTVTSLDVRLARAQTESAAAQVAARANQLQRSRRQLAVLLGRYPEALDFNAELPLLGAPIPVGLPSDLLTRRPDLIAAERRLAATDQRIRAARKAFLPRISLTASGGRSSDEIANLLDSSWTVWTIAGNLAQPLLQAGAITANIKQQRAAAVEALASYGSLALNAFREVETALAAEELLRIQVERLELAARESEASVDLAVNQYERGLTDVITVLDSQRRAVNDRSAAIDGRAALLGNRIDLHLALGGGFDVEARELMIPLPFETQTTGVQEGESESRFTVERGIEP